MDVCCKMKRMDNVTRSPLFSHVAATVNGLQTIHAYNRERDFLTEFVLQPRILLYLSNISVTPKPPLHPRTVTVEHFGQYS